MMHCVFRLLPWVFLSVLPASAQSLGPWTEAPPLPDHSQHAVDSVHHYFPELYAAGSIVGVLAGPCEEVVLSRVNRDGTMAPWSAPAKGAYETRGGDAYALLGNRLFSWCSWSRVRAGTVDPATGLVSGWRILTKNPDAINGHVLHGYTGTIGRAPNGRRFLFSFGGLNYGGGDHASARILPVVCWAAVESPAVWQDTTPLPAPAMSATALPYGDRLIVLGGGDSTDPRGRNSDAVLMADVQPGGGVGAWRRIGAMPYAARGVAAFIQNDVLYVVGGVGLTPRAEAHAAAIGADGTLGPWKRQPDPPAPVGMYGFATAGPYAVVSSCPPDGKQKPRVFTARFPDAAGTGEPAALARGGPAPAKPDAPRGPAGSTPPPAGAPGVASAAGADPTAYAELDRAMALAAKKEVPAAFAALEHVFESWPDSVCAELAHGRLRELRGDPAVRAARDAYDRGKEADNLRGDVWGAVQEKDVPHAMPLLERLAGEFAGTPAGAWAREQLDAWRKDPAMADALARNLADDVKKFWAMAENYRKSRMFGKAEDYYRKIIDAQGAGDAALVESARGRIKEMAEETR